jgi:hypothetical protein
MKFSWVLFSMALSLPMAAQACPIGMQYIGNGCSPPYERNMDDWIRERHDYLDSLGPKNRAPVRSLTREEVENLKRLQAEKDKRDLKIAQELARGVWFSDSSQTPEGKLCVATFAKASREDNGKSGGMVSILGFQQPKPDAWLIFYGTGLPTPRDVKKIKVTLQQDDEPGQEVQVFSYRHERKIGAIAFAVPGLAAALDGMRDKQSFKLTVDGQPAMSIQWADAAAVIQQLGQCAK